MSHCPAECTACQRGVRQDELAACRLCACRRSWLRAGDAPATRLRLLGAFSAPTARRLTDRVARRAPLDRQPELAAAASRVSMCEDHGQQDGDVGGDNRGNCHRGVGVHPHTLAPVCTHTQHMGHCANAHPTANTHPTTHPGRVTPRYGCVTYPKKCECIEQLTPPKHTQKHTRPRYTALRVRYIYLPPITSFTLVGSCGSKPYAPEACCALPSSGCVAPS